MLYATPCISSQSITITVISRLGIRGFFLIFIDGLIVSKVKLYWKTTSP